MSGHGIGHVRPGRQRVAAVSGTSSGIGAAVAEAFLDRGYAVVGLSRRGNARLTDRKDYVDIPVDLRSARQTAEALASVPQICDGLNAVVMNAGASPPARDLLDVGWPVAAEAFETNVGTALHLVQACTPALRTAGGGALVFVGASIANGYEANRWPYAASKAALTTLMRACSTALAGDGIVANEVRPGPVATPMTLGAGTGEVRPEILRALNEGFGIDWLKSPATVAGWIVSLAELPSNGPTGQVFNYSRRTL
ncbi:SDR family oxidoreductase [Frankia sp. AgKG'84/4]|uniref:SDR family oxidoreductase n=1 Tax=Frankia sp. AgKG'84/4 TaxID=573490 RepID=UPI00200BD5E2|nr:SDR family oxidoreductase [Frankia sp. AgKG'84/4]MCL9793445.1 SDR family oxidoreductase [Frankia sp. AgKG'84/4]